MTQSNSSTTGVRRADGWFGIVFVAPIVVLVVFIALTVRPLRVAGRLRVVVPAV